MVNFDKGADLVTATPPSESELSQMLMMLNMMMKLMLVRTMNMMWRDAPKASRRDSTALKVTITRRHDDATA